MQAHTCEHTRTYGGVAPLSPAPAWRSPCRNSRRRLTGHSTDCISPSWLLHSSLQLFHPWSPLEVPGHAPISSRTPVHKRATPASDQCYRCCTEVSVIPDPHRLPLSPSQCLDLSLSLTDSKCIPPAQFHSLLLSLQRSLCFTALAGITSSLLDESSGWGEGFGGGEGGM